MDARRWLIMEPKFIPLSIIVLLTCVCSAFGQTGVPSGSPGYAVEKKKEIIQEKEKEKERILQREQELDRLILAATNQRIEVSADIFFSALDAKLIKDPKKQREMIEDIFRRASEAKERYRRAFRYGNVDSRSGYLGYAFDQSLDGLSIQLRAIKLMLAFDRQKARTLFRELPDIKLAPLSCEDDLDYEVSLYYKVLRDIVDQTFDAEARQRHEHIYFAASYVDSIASPAQVRPIIDLITSVKATPQEFDILLGSFTQSLRRVSVDPRSFAFSIGYGQISAEIKHTLLPKIERAGSQATQLLGAYRQYLVKQLSAAQCSDALMTSKPDKMNPAVEFANTLFTNPLTEDDVKPEKIEGRAKKFEYWHSQKSARLLRDIKKLRFGGTNTELTSAERSTQEWQQELIVFLQAMDEWVPEDEETESDYFHQRNVLYDGLIQMAPPPSRPMILLDYALFLRDSGLQKSGPAQWLFYLKRLLSLGKKLKGKERDEFVRVLSGASYDSVSLYFELDRLTETANSKQ